jgi:hypothetical protein
MIPIRRAKEARKAKEAREAASQIAAKAAASRRKK